MNESLSDKLRSLGVKTGVKDLLPPSPAPLQIEDVVSGNFVDTPFGVIFSTVTVCDSAYTHGTIPFTVSSLSPRFIRWADPSLDSAPFDLTNILFLDTETTGLAGGTGTLPFMVGLGRFTPQGFSTRQLFMRNPAEERAQLDVLAHMLAGASAIVTYNGKAFDAPILKTRYVMNAIPSPLNDLAHFDLLPLSRRLWKRRLDNRSLKDIESEIIGFTRDQLEVPGWEIPILYFNYLRTGDPRPLAGVFYHNVIDIQSLAAIFLLMNNWASEPAGLSDRQPVDSLSLAIQMEGSGEIEAAITLYEQLLSADLPGVYRSELQLRYARLLKRDGNYQRAAEVLVSDKAHKEIKVMIQLAKVLEHQQRNYEEALAWTDQALDHLSEAAHFIPAAENNKLKPDLLKRQSRLHQKIKTAEKHV